MLRKKAQVDEAKPKKAVSQEKGAATLTDEQLSLSGVSALVQRGLAAETEMRFKNRVIVTLMVFLAISLIANLRMSGNDTVVRLLGVTPDGRYRDLPLLSDPIYSHQDIMAWSERCIQNLYRLSYVDWRTTIQNETLCLSDSARAGFVDSLKSMGLLEYLTPEHQGTMYAVPERAVVRAARLTDQGYQEWVVDVPYRVVLDGRRRGQIEVVMTMQVRRVSLMVRESGIWVHGYQINPRTGSR